MKHLPSRHLIHTSLITFAALSVTACQQAEQPQHHSIKEAQTGSVATVDIANPSPFNREDEAIYLSYYDLGVAPNTTLAVNIGNNQVANQAIDKDLDGKNDGILFVTDLSKGENIHAEIISTTRLAPSKKRVQADLAHKVGGEWVPHTRPPKHQQNAGMKEYVGGQFKNVQSITPPEYYTDHSNWIRYEGPGIESDKVGYRIYLDWRNGFDIFGKLTPEPVLHNVGLDGYKSYHSLQDWGMDLLKVGGSLGAGGFAYTNEKGKLEHVSKVDTRTASITANGDLFAQIQLDYHGWQNSVQQQDLSAFISMQAGSPLAEVTLKLDKPLDNITAGLVKHPDTTFLKADLQSMSNYGYGYIASWGKQSLDGKALGMVVFFKKGDVKTVRQDDKNYLVELTPKGQQGSQQVHYYFASLWQAQSGINTVEQFEHYIKQQAQKLTIKPRIQLKTSLTQNAMQASISAESALKWTQAFADSELARKTLGYHYNGWDVNRKRSPKFEYDIIGIQPYAYYTLGELTDNAEYKQVIEKVTGSFISEDGLISAYKQSNFNIDNIPPGRNLITLYQQTNEQKYLKAIHALREQLHKHPRTSTGAFWHKKKYQGQVWLDGVYMGMPFLAEYAALFESGHQQQETFAEVVNEFNLTREFLKDTQTGLYYHGWDELKQQAWANKSTGLSHEVWARGMGWLAMAVVDVLDYIPEQNSQQRKHLLTMVQEIADSLEKTQDPATGTWWQVMDKPNAIGNYRESSATAMFTYFYAKAINKGYLSTDYLATAYKAYQGLLNEFTLLHQDGTVSMTNQCYVAGLGYGRDGSYDYYMSEPVVANDPKGNAAYILAGTEMVKLLRQKSK
ncbi:glycoside hydrolase family 88 protein [Pseudoalteromonas lipolytica]|uniref:glycoside hydrolase family 88 protein n=1 Tax=Pseudoalteromonas lipolytica TaxID=570156 RepID=UPI00241DC7CB|nr:glycoside hydrolase family 88 protein [Pseudoalteromonas lipolytica]|tara:strand:- start:3897 stop:6431 length:2535 start_codon:yes stop_codon:yes gene_type:complete